MSDLNDLIHTNAVNAFENGVKTEQQRIVTLLTEVRNTWSKPTSFNYLNELDNLIALIKGQK